LERQNFGLDAGVTVAVIRLHKKGQMTLPQEIRNHLALEEGDFLEIEVQHGAVVLRPKKLVDASQAYFWSDAWQAGEQQASSDIAEGRTEHFADADAAVAYLHDEAAKRRNRQ
jgi:AbrB family looped-hinge helix DNA binding protein